jgi:hypothetical protein
MLRFYTNKELSHRFNINIAKLKRWSREFLPPDPLGGFQSGFPRQYNPDEAFALYLGGYLVGELKFTIPEARQILLDLREWLIENRYYYNFGEPLKSGKKPDHPAEQSQIFIMRMQHRQDVGFGFFYIIREIILKRKFSDSGRGLMANEERYTEHLIDPHHNLIPISENLVCRIIYIDDFRNRFLSRLS